MDTRMGPAPRAQRKGNEGPIAMTARPSRNSGASVKGLYDIPTDSWVYIQNELGNPPKLVDALDGLFVQWGAPAYGSGTPFDPGTTGLHRGATLYGLDEDDNPYVVDQADLMTFTHAGGSAYGGPLGTLPAACLVDDMGDTLAEITIRGLQYGPFPAAYILHPPVYQMRSFQVVGSAIQMGERYVFSFVTSSYPPGPPLYGYLGLPSPDFVWDFTALTVCGFGLNSALLFAWSYKDGDASLDPKWLCLWSFDPFDLEGTLKDPADYPLVEGVSIARQPDVIYERSSLGLQDSLSLFRVVARNDNEAVVVALSAPSGSSLAGTKVHVIRFDPAGGIISNWSSPAADAEGEGDWESQYFASSPNPQNMGDEIVHSGDLRVDGSGQGRLGLPYPNHDPSVFNYWTSPTYVGDPGTGYLYIHKDTTVSPVKTTFVFRDLDTDEDVRIVTSYSDVDAEVYDMNQYLLGSGLTAYVDHNLLFSYRAAGAFYPRHNLVTIELGVGRQAGTAQIITEDRRFHRLPQGLS